MQVQDFLKVAQASNTAASNRTRDTSGFQDALEGAPPRAEETGAGKATVAGVRMDNPLAPDMWPDRFAARIEYAAEKLGMTPDQAKQAFAEISLRAKEEGGLIDPKGFLKSLSPEDREVLQRVQGKADRITDGAIDGFDHEGAFNLLLPPGAQRDLNNDGFREIGDGLIFQIPPDSAPQEMKDAWAELTEDMNFHERAMAEGHFLALFASANVQYDASGKPVGMYGPRDPGYRNPFEIEGFSYRGVAYDHLASLEDFRGQIGEAQYREEKAFWTRYLQKLDKFGVEDDQKQHRTSA